jgi:uncharacterized membrane protein
VPFLNFLQPKPKVFFTETERSNMVEAIRAAEKNTSGEIRVFVESKCRYVDAIDRAKEVFFFLEMDKTELHNATLVYVALKDKQMAVYGDEGIYKQTGETFWKNAVQKMSGHFKQANIPQGIITTIGDIGEALKSYFPYNAETDVNELPDDIVFGR